MGAAFLASAPHDLGGEAVRRLIGRIRYWVLGSLVVSQFSPGVALSAGAPLPRQQPDDPTVLLVAGGTVTGSGLLMATTGFGLLAGIHVGNPEPGMAIGGFDDPAQSTKVVRTARAMQGVGIAGAVLAVAGAVVLGVGLYRLRRQRVDSPRRATALRLDLSGGGLRLRF